MTTRCITATAPASARSSARTGDAESAGQASIVMAFRSRPRSHVSGLIACWSVRAHSTRMHDARSIADAAAALDIQPCEGRRRVAKPMPEVWERALIAALMLRSALLERSGCRAFSAVARPSAATTMRARAISAGGGRDPPSLAGHCAAPQSKCGRNKGRRFRGPVRVSRWQASTTSAPHSSDYFAEARPRARAVRARSCRATTRR